jgi:hypothetical protein
MGHGFVNIIRLNLIKGMPTFIEATLHGVTAMKPFLAITALAAIIAIPAFAPSQPAQAQTYSKEQSAPQKVKKAKTQKHIVRNGSPYSTNPAHDVYVNGVYVGSDPDPRIRWTLKKEYCEDSVDGC